MDQAVDRVTVYFRGGPCDGHTADLDRRDAGRTIRAAVVEGQAYVLDDIRTVFNDDVMRAAHAKWEWVDGREHQVSPGLWTVYTRDPASDPLEPVYRVEDPGP